MDGLPIMPVTDIKGTDRIQCILYMPSSLATYSPHCILGRRDIPHSAVYKTLHKTDSPHCI